MSTKKIQAFITGGLDQESYSNQTTGWSNFFGKSSKQVLRLWNPQAWMNSQQCLDTRCEGSPEVSPPRTYWDHQSSPVLLCHVELLIEQDVFIWIQVWGLGKSVHKIIAKANSLREPLRISSQYHCTVQRSEEMSLPPVIWRNMNDAAGNRTFSRVTVKLMKSTGRMSQEQCPHHVLYWPVL